MPGENLHWTCFQSRWPFASASIVHNVCVPLDFSLLPARPCSVPFTSPLHSTLYPDPQNGDEPPETSPFNAMLSILRPIGANGLGSGGTGSASSGWTMGGTNFNGDSPLGAFGMSSTSPSFSSYRMLPSNLAASPHGMANILSTQAVSPSTHAAALPLSFYGIDYLSILFAAEAVFATDMFCKHAARNAACSLSGLCFVACCCCSCTQWDQMIPQIVLPCYGTRCCLGSSSVGFHLT